MAEDDRLCCVPVLVVELFAVVRGDRGHNVLSLGVILFCYKLRGTTWKCG
jgi:hypothetical protein